jgi:hypothetical protein
VIVFRKSGSSRCRGLGLEALREELLRLELREILGRRGAAEVVCRRNREVRIVGTRKLGPRLDVRKGRVGDLRELRVHGLDHAAVHVEEVLPELLSRIGRLLASSAGLGGSQ